MSEEKTENGEEWTGVWLNSNVVSILCCVGTRFDMTEIVELEDSKSAACLLLPQLPGVDIYSFTISDVPDADFLSAGAGDQLNSNRSGNQLFAADDDVKMFSDTDIDNTTKIPADKTVRAILLFLAEMSATDSEFYPSLVRRYGAKNVLVAGGFADRVLTGSSHSK